MSVLFKLMLCEVPFFARFLRSPFGLTSFGMIREWMTIMNSPIPHQTTRLTTSVGFMVVVVVLWVDVVVVNTRSYDGG